MKNLALERIQRMSAYKPPLASRRDYDGLLLDFNERSLPPDDKAAAAAASISKLQVYPEYAELEKLIAVYAGVGAEQVMLTNGSDQGIEVIFRTFTDTGHEVIIPAPSFDMFFQAAGVIGNRISSPLYAGEDLHYPLDEVLKAVHDDTKLVVICNPNNPTGSLLPLEGIEKIAKKAEGSIVYVDEAYFEYSHVTAVGLIEKYPNIIVSRTFSKAFGLAALRVGYIIADERNIAEMMKVRGPYPVNMAGYEAACAILAEKDKVLEYSEEVMKRAKPMVEEFLRQNSIEFYPSSSNFILIRPRNAKEVFEKLEAAGILLRQQNKPSIEGTLRLSIGSYEQMKRFCEIYRKTVL